VTKPVTVTTTVPRPQLVTTITTVTKVTTAPALSPQKTIEHSKLRQTLIGGTKVAIIALLAFEEVEMENCRSPFNRSLATTFLSETFFASKKWIPFWTDLQKIDSSENHRIIGQVSGENCL
jgi:hypothetical protein